MNKSVLALCCSVLLVGNAGAEEMSADKATPMAKQTAPATKQQAAVKKVDLKTAYKREFAFLQSQKRELGKRLAEFKAKARADEIKLQAKIAGLERTTIRLASELQDMEDQIRDSERTAAALEERSEALNMTYQQAESSLKNYSIDLGLEQVFQTGSDERKVEMIFAEATKLLNKLSSIQSHEGRFYLNNGKQTQGKIIELGNIAAYGVSSEGSGALVPAGGEQMKLWHLDTADVAQALANGSEPKQLNVFLYESRSKAIEEKSEKTWLSVVNSGGIIGWVIVGLGAFGMLLVLVRAFLLQRNSSSSHQIEDQIVKVVSNGSLEDAQQACQHCKGAIARVLSATLRHVKDDRDHMEDIITEAILHESNVLNKFGSTILVIASVSPLLGLLGTVTGMISTFDIITEFGTGDPKLLSSGISVALVTTELGLIVAIPTLLLGTLLSSWAETIKLDMEKVALKITNIVLSEPETKLASTKPARQAA